MRKRGREPGGERRAQRTKRDEWPQEGIRKLHSEILQLDNQRFLVTTTSLVLFGTVAGWVTTTLLRTGGSADPQQQTASMVSPLLYLPPAITALMWAVLYLLFRYQMSLALTIRWLAAYHMLKGSDWEWTWYSFRAQHRDRPAGELPYVSGYQVTTNIFALLMVASYAYFLVLQIVLSPPAVPDTLASLRQTFVALLPTWNGLLPGSLTPAFCWILLTVALPFLLLSIKRKNRQVLASEEGEFMRDWQRAEAASPSPVANPPPDEARPGAEPVAGPQVAEGGR